MNYIKSSNYYNPAIFVWLLTITAMVLLIIVIGGLTRLTDSGLSMTDWRPILGIIPPIGFEKWMIVFEMYKQTPEYKIVNKNMSLDEFKYIFWWEWFHRIFARAIGVVFIIPLIYFSLKKQIQSSLKSSPYSIDTSFSTYLLSSKISQKQTKMYPHFVFKI